MDTPHFYASLNVAEAANVAGLARWPEQGVLLRVPKIPVKWLVAALEHARRCGGRQANGKGVIYRPIEQMYHFHYFSAAEGWPPGWRVSVPKQQASAGRVSYRGGSEPTIVLDLHSHHEMDAYFSSTDNRDEQGCRFYAVIGCIYSRPEIRLRLGLFGDFIELEPALLFEGLGPFTLVGKDIEWWKAPSEAGQRTTVITENNWNEISDY